MRHHRPYFRAIAATSLGNTLASALAAGVLLPVLIRRIGLEAYGQWALLQLFVAASSLLDLGVLKAVVVVLSSGRLQPGRVLGSAFGISAIAASFFLSGLVVAWLLGVNLFGAIGLAHPGIAAWLCVCGAIVVTASLATNMLRAALEARLRGDLVNVGFAALTVLQYGGLTLVAAFTVDPRWLLAVSSLVYMLVLVLHWAQLRILGAIPPLGADSSVARVLLDRGWKSYVSEVPLNLLAPGLLYLYVHESGSGSQYGVLDLALRISTLAASALSALAVPFLAIAASEGAADPERLRTMALKFVRLTLLLAIAGCLVFALAGNTLLRFLFGAEAHAIWRASCIVLCGAALVAALEPVARLLLGSGRPARLLLARWAMPLVTATALWLLPVADALTRYAVAGALGYLACAFLLASGLLPNRRPVT